LSVRDKIVILFLPFISNSIEISLQSRVSNWLQTEFVAIRPAGQLTTAAAVTAVAATYAVKKLRVETNEKIFCTAEQQMKTN
jgi:hypothetical protein